MLGLLSVISLVCVVLAGKIPNLSAQCGPSSSCSSGYKCMAGNCVLDVRCPSAEKFGSGPPATCDPPSDPNDKPTHVIESWFTEPIFNDLFPKANIGWGPSTCWPYSYDAFKFAIRYFPTFANTGDSSTYTADQNARRELATFFAHAIQETGENDADLYKNMGTKEDADACFYRGGFYNWFEGGPESNFIQSTGRSGYQPGDGVTCNLNGQYCESDLATAYFYPCNNASNGSTYYGCYFGRGAIQLSYNFNYGLFNDWLNDQGIHVDLLTNPNLLISQTNPPLAILASLWYYMTPQPPKPAMHDVITGNWAAGLENSAAGFSGPIFGPTSLVINNECTGEDTEVPGGPGENRRIKAFKFFCSYFNVPTGPKLSCLDMPQRFGALIPFQSYEPDWLNTWREKPCNCVASTYAGMVPYYEPAYFSEEFVQRNDGNRKRCIDSIYAAPMAYNMDPTNSRCLLVPKNYTV